jgi:phosphorylcholine metabolism protein LicD
MWKERNGKGEKTVKTTDIGKIQTICVQLLAELDRICRDNEITYYMIAVTLLGAG